MSANDKIACLPAEAADLSVCTCLSHPLSYTLSVEDGLPPAFVGCEGPQTVSDGRGERSRFDAQVQELQARTVQLAVHWTKSGPGQLLRQLETDRSPQHY